MRQLADYMDKYPRRRFVIVGRGPTSFDYEQLRQVADPVIFINDAVQLEHLAESAPETFFFAHDQCQKVWLTPELESTAVLPLSGPRPEPGAHQRRLFVTDTPEARSVQSLITYTWGSRYLAGGRKLSTVSRAEVARTGGLALCGNCWRDGFCGGTIHTAIHFAWFCGADEITFIGCDGVRQGYEKRLEDRSQGVNLEVHDSIRNTTDLICRDLGLETSYISHAIDQKIPRRAHFVWMGSKQPRWLGKVVRAFMKHNPLWAVKVWAEWPEELDAGLREAVKGAQQFCQWADILYCYILREHGGVVMDTDSITVRPFDPLLELGPAWTTRHNASSPRLTNGVMGSVPRGRAFKDACAMIASEHVAMVNGTRPWARCMYGPDMLTQMFTPEGDDRMKVLPHWYFYPWRVAEREQAVRFWEAGEAERRTMLKSLGNPEPYAVHLYGIDGSGHREVREAVGVGA